jgi:hypothetical protein
MKPFILVLFLLFLNTSFLFAQTVNNQSQYQVKIQRTNQKIKIDGNLDDTAWKDAALLKDFIEKFPNNEDLAKTKTEVKITYDDDFLYFGATCYATKPYVVTTLKRDVSLRENDGFVVVLDPVNIKTNGYTFGVTPYGVQTEGLATANAGEVSFDWNTKWFSEVQQYDDRYTIEMAIPLRVLRYESGKKEWGLNFIRSNLKIGEFSTWARVPIQFPGFDLGFLGKMIFDDAPKRTKNNIVVIPYLNTAYSKVENIASPSGFDEVTKPNVGFDAKIALNSSLNLDVAVNPDFSQVDVDKQVTNLTRFNIFLPERRTFFLENGDVFNNFGAGPIKPFFSRTIGLDKDGLPLPILYGLRLTGNTSKNTRVGLMNVHTLGKTKADAAQNVSMAVVQQNLFGRSYVKAMLINRQGFEGAKSISEDYGRNVGVETALISKDGKFTATAAYHNSYRPNNPSDHSFGMASVLYAGKNWRFFCDFIPVQTNYFADRGFINRIRNYDAERDVFIRQGYYHSFHEIRYTVYPKKGVTWFQKQDYGIMDFVDWNIDGSFNERNTNFSINYSLKNLSNVIIGFGNSDVALNYPIRFTDKKPLPAIRYHFSNINASYSSDRRKLFSYKIDAKTGTFYNGTINSTMIGLIYRVRPWGNFEANYEYNDLKFPEPYGKNTLQLFGGKVEVNFSRNLAWTTFVQSNTQNNTFNFNSRVQWRFKPMSDVFLVYTDNYGTTGSLASYLPKYRALVLKISYWLNV